MMFYLTFLLLAVQLALCNGRSAIYQITHGSSNTSLQCAVSSLGMVALRVRDSDEECEPLTHDWYNDKAYEDGYTYLETKMFTESFAANQLIGLPNTYNVRERMWTIPGLFEVNAKLDIYLTTPPVFWTWVWFRIFDTPIGGPYRLNDDIPELLLLVVEIEHRDEKIKFLSKIDGVWDGAPDLEDFRFDYNTTVKLTMKAENDGMQVLFDDIPQATVPHIALPETAQTLVVRFQGADESSWPKIKNITFYRT